MKLENQIQLQNIIAVLEDVKEQETKAGSFEEQELEGIILGLKNVSMKEENYGEAMAERARVK